jgi:hypothetical protein
LRGEKHKEVVALQDIQTPQSLAPLHCRGADRELETARDTVVQGSLLSPELPINPPLGRHSPQVFAVDEHGNRFNLVQFGDIVQFTAFSKLPTRETVCFKILTSDPAALRRRLEALPNTSAADIVSFDFTATETEVEVFALNTSNT